MLYTILSPNTFNDFSSIYESSIDIFFNTDSNNYFTPPPRFFCLKKMKIRLGKFHKSSTSQSRLITYSTDVSLIIPLILSLHHRENVSTTPSVQRWTYKTHLKIFHSTNLT